MHGVLHLLMLLAKLGSPDPEKRREAQGCLALLVGLGLWGGLAGWLNDVLVARYGPRGWIVPAAFLGVPILLIGGGLILYLAGAFISGFIEGWKMPPQPEENAPTPSEEISTPADEASPEAPPPAPEIVPAAPAELPTDFNKLMNISFSTEEANSLLDWRPDN
ncbi:MAG: hypothetical protein FJX76_06235 [Armatimonadetes bacterium]|nr:hypothetical protein [Armatimonadota bacterium]